MATHLEIGVGQDRTSAYGDAKNIPLGEGDLFVTLDLKKQIGSLANQDIALGPFRSEDRELRSSAFNYVPMYGDGRRIPLADKSVDEVVLGNVVGDVMVGARMISAILNDSLRVIKDGSEIIIRETYTPDVAEEHLKYFMDHHPKGVKLRELELTDPRLASFARKGLSDRFWAIYSYSELRK